MARPTTSLHVFILDTIYTIWTPNTCASSQIILSDGQTTFRTWPTRIDASLLLHHFEVIPRSSGDVEAGQQVAIFCASWVEPGSTRSG